MPEGARDTPRPQLLSSPAQLVAFGFGSGLSPWAPGTVGTLAAIPLYLLLSHLDLWLYSAVILAAVVFGTWICNVASRQLEVHDHPGIVWDEFVGFWLAMWAMPPDWEWIVSAFVVFRIFDIIKPWPISVLDRNVGGGWGIMVDDLVAGGLACLTLHIAMLLL
jgi:phosphatidylglycerophosphatase A